MISDRLGFESQFHHLFILGKFFKIPEPQLPKLYNGYNGSTHLMTLLCRLKIPIPKKGNVKEYSNYHTTALISHASKVMLKILQARLQQYMNCEIPDVQSGFRNGRVTIDQIANIRWIMEKARVPEKHLFLLY